MSERKYSPKDIASILRVCYSGSMSCAGCKLNKDKSCDNVNIELQAADAIEELLAQVSWIRVGDRLPDLDDGAVLIDGEMAAVQVLAVIKGAKQSTELYFDGEEFFDYTGDEIIPYRVTHWRPMPEVPGEED